MHGRRVEARPAKDHVLLLQAQAEVRYQGRLAVRIRVREQCLPPWRDQPSANDRGASTGLHRLQQHKPVGPFRPVWYSHSGTIVDQRGNGQN